MLWPISIILSYLRSEQISLTEDGTYNLNSEMTKVDIWIASDYLVLMSLRFKYVEESNIIYFLKIGVIILFFFNFETNIISGGI